MGINDLSALCKCLICELNIANQWNLPAQSIDIYCDQVLVHASYYLKREFSKKNIDTPDIDFLGQNHSSRIRAIIINYHTDSFIINLLKYDKSDQSVDSCQNKIHEYFINLSRKKFKSLPPYLEPEDVVNTAWVKILSKLDEFHYLSQFRTWCSSIIINTGIELIRKHWNSTCDSMDEPGRNGEQSLGETIPDPGPDQETSLLCEERSCIIQKAIDEVISLSSHSDRNREILRLRIAGVKGKDIAHQLNISENTINLVMARLKMKLRNLLSEEADMPNSKKIANPC